MLRTSRVALAGLFVALALGVDLVTAAIPNVELLSLTVFLGGAATGPAVGCAIGIGTELIHSLLNPLGPAFPLVFLAQLAGMGTVGLVGGLLGPRVARLARGPAVGILALLGFSLTTFFDLLTNAALGIHLGALWLTIAGGIPFAIAHIVSNTILFAALGLGGLRVLRELGVLAAGESAPG